MNTSVGNFTIPSPENFTLTNFSTSREEWTWLLDMNDIKPGHSTILGENEIIFYGIHYTGIFCIIISMISCTAVIFSVFRNSKQRANWDFSDRFPLYLAISDGLWGLSNLSGGHAVLVMQQTFPEKHAASMFAINVFLFFCYQQLMNAGLSLYTYLKVVRQVSIDLGRWEWKLHATVVSFLLSNVALYYYVDAFGNSGFWFVADMNTIGGKLMVVSICVTSTIHALLTLIAYRAIQNVIKKQKRVVSYIQSPSSTIGPDWSRGSRGVLGFLHNKEKVCTCNKPIEPIHENTDTGRFSSQQGYHSTATNCLNTFIYISICLYFPFAITTWVYLTFGLFNFIEPISALIIVVAGNSGGWVNAIGYLRNKKLKEKRRKYLITSVARANLYSTSSSSTNT